MGWARCRRATRMRASGSDAERLGQVVVGPGVEGGHLVPLLAPAEITMIGAWNGGPGYEVEAVEVGKAEVEQDDVRVASGCVGQSLARRGGFDDLIIVRPKRGPQEAPHLRLILYQKDQGTRSSPWVSALLPQWGGAWAWVGPFRAEG